MRWRRPTSRWPARSACSWWCRSSGRACSTSLATVGSGWRWAPRAFATASLDGRTFPAGRAVVFCANHQSNVDPPVLFRALHHQLHVLFKAELRQAADLRQGDGGRRVRGRGTRPPRRGAGLDRRRRRVDSPRQLLPDLPRGHAQPHRRALALQEGRLHHGHQGAGADPAGGDHGWTRGHAQGQRDRAAGHRVDSDWHADRDRWPRPGRTRYRNCGTCAPPSRRCSPRAR